MGMSKSSAAAPRMSATPGSSPGPQASSACLLDCACKGNEFPPPAEHAASAAPACGSRQPPGSSPCAAPSAPPASAAACWASAPLACSAPGLEPCARQLPATSLPAAGIRGAQAAPQPGSLLQRALSGSGSPCASFSPPGAQRKRILGQGCATSSLGGCAGLLRPGQLRAGPALRAPLLPGARPVLCGAGGESALHWTSAGGWLGRIVSGTTHCTARGLCEAAGGEANWTALGLGGSPPAACSPAAAALGACGGAAASTGSLPLAAPASSSRAAQQKQKCQQCAGTCCAQASIPALFALQVPSPE